jgi:hypothetical protein
MPWYAHERQRAVPFRKPTKRRSWLSTGLMAALVAGLGIGVAIVVFG